MLYCDDFVVPPNEFDQEFSVEEQIVLMLYSRLSLSRLRLSRITAYLEEKILSLF